jgi:hypothetical protein
MLLYADLRAGKPVPRITPQLSQTSVGTTRSNRECYARWTMSDHSKPPPAKSSWPEVMRALGPYLNIGWTFVVALGLGMLGGRWADTRLGTEPWFFLLGAVLGIAAGFYSFFMTISRK